MENTAVKTVAIVDAPAVHPPIHVKTKKNYKERGLLKSRGNLFLYVFFYLFFSPDTWRILIGFLAAIIIGPRVVALGNYSPAAQAIIWVMILTLGYVLSAPLGRFISIRLTAAFKRK